MYKRNIEAPSHDHCCCGKAISFSNSESLSVALVIQHAKSVRGILLYLSSVWLNHIFRHYLINGTISKKIIIEYIPRVFSPHKFV